MNCDHHAALLEYPAGRDLRVGGLAGSELEELYARTFDINPVCCLEIGWQLYGEDYQRGAFLVEMRARMREHGLAESAELPDHLSHALRLLGRLEPAEGARFARHFVLPAVERMLKGFGDRANPYRGVLETLAAELRAGYGEPIPPAPLHRPYECAASCGMVHPPQGE